jgi:predicted N-acetyltransferase YhbS
MHSPGTKLKGEPIRFDVLQAPDIDAMIHLIATAFSTAEPMGVAARVSTNDLSGFLQMLAGRTIGDGLTVVARSSTGQLVGGLLTDDFAIPPPLEIERLSPSFLPILEILESLDAQYRSRRTIRSGEYLHLFMLAVDPQFGGRGIAQGLVAHCIENGKRMGYRWAVTEATGLVSQQVFRRIGFEERARIPYCDFRYGGATVFASITEHDGVALMDKAL